MFSFVSRLQRQVVSLLFLFAVRIANHLLKSKFNNAIYFVPRRSLYGLFSERELVFTIAICYRPSVCCLFVCLLSVTLVHPTQAVELFGIFFSPYDSPGTLLFWCQKSLVGDAPFPLKFAFKVTHPFKQRNFD